jgi:hypothetical protein
MCYFLVQHELPVVKKTRSYLAKLKGRRWASVVNTNWSMSKKREKKIHDVFQCCGSALVSIFNADPDPAF